MAQTEDERGTESLLDDVLAKQDLLLLLVGDRHSADLGLLRLAPRDQVDGHEAPEDEETSEEIGEDSSSFHDDLLLGGDDLVQASRHDHVLDLPPEHGGRSEDGGLEGLETTLVWTGLPDVDGADVVGGGLDEIAEFDHADATILEPNVDWLLTDHVCFLPESSCRF